MDVFKLLIGSCYSVNNFVIIFETLGVDSPRSCEDQLIIWMVGSNLTNCASSLVSCGELNVPPHFPLSPCSLLILPLSCT